MDFIGDYPDNDHTQGAWWWIASNCSSPRLVSRRVLRTDNASAVPLDGARGMSSKDRIRSRASTYRRSPAYVTAHLCLVRKTNLPVHSVHLCTKVDTVCHFTGGRGLQPHQASLGLRLRTSREETALSS
jgi:hypothetical protein